VVGLSVYDGKKIVLGLIVFLGILTFPFWYNAASGKAGYLPKPEAPKDQKECIEPKAFIRVNHKALLEDWRLDVVRNGMRTYEAQNKKKYTKSLSKTCMNCHKDKDVFCQKCHDYAGVSTKCWDCHLYPKQIEPSATGGPAGKGGPA
jgi:hypothetical protein